MDRQRMANTVQQSNDVETLRAPEGEHQQAQHMGEDSLCFEGLLTNLSRIFVKAPAEDIDRAVQQGLKQVVECLGGDRTSFIEFSSDLSQFHIPHTYVVPGLPEVLGTIMDSARFPWSVDRLQHGKTVQIFEIDELPLDAELDKQQYRDLGIRSIVILPVIMDETVLCALTVATLRETRRWDETFVQRLHLMSEIFANGLLGNVPSSNRRNVSGLIG